MKKLFLTFAVVGLGAATAFAQEVESVQQQEELQIEKLSNPAEMEGKKAIEMSELPQAVQDAFQNSEFKDWEVAAVYAVEAPQEENIQLSNTPEETAVPEENITYEISLVSQEIEEEIEEAEEAVTEAQEEATGEQVEVSTETVKVAVPALLLSYDKEGKLLKQEEQKNDSPLEEKEQY